MPSQHAQWRTADRVYRAVFAHAPCPFLVLTPDLQIVEGNEAYLTATRQVRDGLVGRDMFEAFPDNPDDPMANGVENLGRSFEQAMLSGSRDLMPLQRYDVRDMHGRWKVKYWRPANWPVFDEGRLIALVHHVTDVTEQALTQTRAHAGEGLSLIDRADLATEVARRLRARTSEDLARLRRRRQLRLRARTDD